MGHIFAGAVFSREAIYLFGGVIVIILAVLLSYFVFLRQIIAQRFLESKAVNSLAKKTGVIVMVYIGMIAIDTLLICIYYYVLKVVL